MFVQVIHGRVADAEGLKRQMDRWGEELRPGATGWLGTTAGVTEDGRFIAVARFEDEAVARANSDRPEQGDWWAETEKYLSGEVKFHDTTDVRLRMGGGRDDAGFVQVLHARTDDPARMEELSRLFEEKLPDARPEYIGGFTVRHGEHGFTDVNYFTSEEEARAGEAADSSDQDMSEASQEFLSLIKEPEWFDLKEPWLQSA